MLQTILLFFKATSENPSKERVQQFVDENFSEENYFWHIAKVWYVFKNGKQKQ